MIKKLKMLSRPEAIAGMARYGINPKNVLGVSIPDLRALAKEVGTDHAMARSLWRSGIHEARMLAGMIDDPTLVDEAQMEAWVLGFDSWDVCDQVCANLFQKTPHAYEKAVEWSAREEEFVKRAGFVLMARMAVADKKAKDEMFITLLPLVAGESIDERNMVKKAANWALRQIGKRNMFLNKKALEAAYKIKKIDSKSAKWIASDAIRELESDSVQKRLDDLRSRESRK